MNNLLEAREISKVFEEGNKLIKAVNKINFQINTNEKSLFMVGLDLVNLHY
ncbi:MAG: hypothetical protein CM15mP123_05390 [Gammaproteobacteria bacterium]|nr:MAG: hypothetical protein CM15mP123_05390 [Gammaproteobacteria bacterium]